MPKDLASTGKSIVCLSAGSGWFEVDYRLSQITKQRLIDNGIGCDLVCCGSPPLHTVPLFTYVQPGVDLPGEANIYRVPHWMLVSYTDPPPPPPPLPPCRVTQAPEHATPSQGGHAPPTATELSAGDGSRGVPPPPATYPPLLVPHNVPPFSLPASPVNSPGSAAREAERSPNFDLAASLPEGCVFASPTAGTLPDGAEGDQDDDTSGMAADGHARLERDIAPMGAVGGAGSKEGRSVSGSGDGADHGHPRSSASGGQARVGRAIPLRVTGGASGGGSRSIPWPGWSDRHASADGAEGSPGDGDALSDHLYSSSIGSDQMGCSLPNEHLLPGSSGSFAGVYAAYAELSASPPTHTAFGTSLERHLENGASFSPLSHGRANAGAGAVEPPLRSRQGHLNPFSPSDAQALAKLSHNSYARRRWLHVNHIAHGVYSELPYSNSSVLQHLEHQWTSLSEPAVLPLTTDPTPEQYSMMQTQRSAETSWWQLEVPRQEVLSGIPYAYAMSPEELLQELLCQRLEQVGTLHRPSSLAPCGP